MTYRYKYLAHLGFVRTHLDHFFDWNPCWPIINTINSFLNTEMKARQEEYCRNIFFKGHVCALKTFWSARFLFFRLSTASQLLLRGARSCAATAYSAATRVKQLAAGALVAESTPTLEERSSDSTTEL